jgi:WD40 repeat protein
MTLRGETIHSASFSPDDSRIVTSSDTSAQIWDLVSGQSKNDVGAGTPQIESAEFSQDGTRIVTVSIDPYNKGEAEVWEPVDGTKAVVLQDPVDNDRLRFADFSPDGSHVVTATWDGRTAHVWEVGARRKLRDLIGHKLRITSLVFSRTGCVESIISPQCRIVTASMDRTVRIWKVGSVESPVVLKYNQPLVSVDFSPDGSRIIAASDDQKIVIWDVASRQVIKELPTDGTVYSVAFSNDGKQILSSSDDSLVHVWDARTYESLLQGPAPTTPLSEFDPVTFSRDRSHFVTVSETGDATVWHVFPNLQSIIDYAKRSEPRELTQDECKKFDVDTSSHLCKMASVPHDDRPRPQNSIPWEYMY